jgi:anaerobic selenocysteine-containing dehydrogenase
MDGLATPTGKLELYSIIIKYLSYEPLPPYEESVENPVSRPDLSAEYPLMLITGARFRWNFHTKDFQVPSIRKRHPDPLVQIHPDTAAKPGTNDGD